MKMIKALLVVATLSSSMAAVASPMLSQALQHRDVVETINDKGVTEVTATQLNDTNVRVNFSGNFGINGAKVSFCKDVDFSNGTITRVSGDIECN